jgi:hypothetical protein
MKWIFALLVATVASVASAQYSNGWSSYNDPLTGPVNFRTVFQGNDSCIETMGTWVIADQGAWDSFWARHQGNQNQGRWGNGRGGYVGGAPNFCDFTREQLIIVTLGAQQAGTTVLIDRIDRPDSWHYDVYFSTRQLVIGGRPNASSTPFIIVKTCLPPVRKPLVWWRMWMRFRRSDRLRAERRHYLWRLQRLTNSP